MIYGDCERLTRQMLLSFEEYVGCILQNWRSDSSQFTIISDVADLISVFNQPFFGN